MRINPVNIRTTMLFALLLALLGLLLRVALWHYVSSDMRDAVASWYASASKLGWYGLRGDYTNYSPPYSYLLVIASKTLDANAVSAVKTISVFFDILMAGAAAMVASVFAQKERPWDALPIAVSCGLLVVGLPTISLNSGAWGQSDAVYTAFVVLAVALVLLGNFLGASCVMGIALAFKLQALFVWPAFLALLLCGKIRTLHVAAGAMSYTASLLPAAIAGRSFLDSMSVYLKQGVTWHSLALGAPNLWSVVRMVSDGRSVYTAGVVAGLVFSTIFSLVLARHLARRIRRIGNGEFLPAAAVCALLLPFMLPKMHDRYFFLADVLTVVCTFVSFRWIPVAVLVQVASLAAYLYGPTRSVPLLLTGVLANTIASCLALSCVGYRLPGFLGIVQARLARKVWVVTKAGIRLIRRRADVDYSQVL